MHILIIVSGKVTNDIIRRALQKLTMMLTNVNLSDADKEQQIFNILKCNSQIMTAITNVRRQDYFKRYFHV